MMLNFVMCAGHIKENNASKYLTHQKTKDINSTYLKLFKKIEINVKSKTICSNVLIFKITSFLFLFYLLTNLGWYIQYIYALYKIRYNNLCIWFSTWKGWRLNQSHSKVDPRSKFPAGLADRKNSWAVPNWSSCFALTGAHQHGIAIGQWRRKST